MFTAIKILFTLANIRKYLTALYLILKAVDGIVDGEKAQKIIDKTIMILENVLKWLRVDVSVVAFNKTTVDEAIAKLDELERKSR